MTAKEQLKLAVQFDLGVSTSSKVINCIIHVIWAKFVIILLDIPFPHEDCHCYEVFLYTKQHRDFIVSLLKIMQQNNNSSYIIRS